MPSMYTPKNCPTWTTALATPTCHARPTIEAKAAGSCRGQELAAAPNENTGMCEKNEESPIFSFYKPLT